MPASTIMTLATPKPPIIGITTRGREYTDSCQSGSFPISANYLDAVRAVGGVPILLTPGETKVASVLGILDGLILSGGGDIAPDVYDGDPHPRVDRVCCERDRFEVELAQLALGTRIPILGICRGMQVLQVASGGKLYSHVPDHFQGVDHFNPPDRQPIRHPVRVMPGSRLGAMVGLEHFSVVSWHHQAIEQVALGWRVAAVAEDGLIEAMEHETQWALGIQWHPEYSAYEMGHWRIFAAFVAATQGSLDTSTYWQAAS